MNKRGFTLIEVMVVLSILAIIAMLDVWLGYIGDKVDIFLSFNAICEVIFWPVAWLMGIDPEDCTIVASLLGYKIFANEFVAYELLAFTYRGRISDRSYYIASYALSGFSNFGSIGLIVTFYGQDDRWSLTFNGANEYPLYMVSVDETGEAISDSFKF